jgi:hypothetical protein
MEYRHPPVLERPPLPFPKQTLSGSADPYVLIIVMIDFYCFCCIQIRSYDPFVIGGATNNMWLLLVEHTEYTILLFLLQFVSTNNKKGKKEIIKYIIHGVLHAFDANL